MAESEILTWACDECHQPIEDGEGMFWADVVAAEAAGKARREWDEAHAASASLAEFLTRPRAVGWHFVHYRCDPDPDAAAYMIEVENVRSLWELLGWTSHLMGKSWVAHTDWNVRIARLAREREPRRIARP